MLYIVEVHRIRHFIFSLSQKSKRTEMARCNMPPGVTAHMKMAEKACNYALTDPNTPIIGEMCRFMIDSYEVTGKYRELQTWFGRYESQVQFPNEDADWMWDLTNEWLPGFDFQAFEMWLDSCRVAHSAMRDLLILRPPVCWTAAAVQPKHTAVVGTELVVGKEPNVAPLRDWVPPADLPGPGGEGALAPKATYQAPAAPCQWCLDNGDLPNMHWKKACPKQAAKGKCGICGAKHLSAACPKAKRRVGFDTKRK